MKFDMRIYEQNQRTEVLLGATSLHSIPISSYKTRPQKAVEAIGVLAVIILPARLRAE